MKTTKKILITFDVEELDTPLRNNITLPAEEQFKIGQEGLLKIIYLLDTLQNPPCTFYTTANYALRYPETICQLSNKHEIASHTFYHSTFHPNDIQKSKDCIEEIIQKKIFGFRMPRMAAFDKSLISKAGYLYDSSINPTFLPGKYNYLSSSIHPYKYHNTIEIPASVVPYIRFPLFWLSFKLLPLSVFIKLCNFTLQQTGFLNLYFHPWEFANLEKIDLPKYMKTPNGEMLVEKLKKLLQYFASRSDVRFEKTVDFCIELEKSI